MLIVDLSNTIGCGGSYALVGRPHSNIFIDLESNFTFFTFICIDRKNIDRASAEMSEDFAGGIYQMLRLKVIVSSENLGVTTVQDKLAASGNREFTVTRLNVYVETIATIL